MPLEVNHLCPLITHSSPSSTAVVDISTGSEPAWSGSVMENPDRSRPARRGWSHRSFCAGLPKLASTSELPESGAWLPNTVGAQGDMPSISCIRPSLTCPKPWPPSSGVRWAAHRPCFLTWSWSERTIRMKVRSSVSRTSSGKTSRFTKSRIHSSLASNSGSVEKSHVIQHHSLPENSREA